MLYSHWQRAAVASNHYEFCFQHNKNQLTSVVVVTVCDKFVISFPFSMEFFHRFVFNLGEKKSLQVERNKITLIWRQWER